MTKIFISYSTDDLAWVSKLTDELLEKGFDVFMADKKMQAGEYIDSTIQKNIDNCNIFVVVWSSNSSKSQWVQQEIGFAKVFDKYIYPIVLDENCRPNGFILGLKYFQAYKEYQSVFQEIVKELDCSHPKVKQYHLFIICGLSSSGKDSLLSHLYFSDRLNKVSPCVLARYTTRVTNSTEESKEAILNRRTVYRSVHITKKELECKDKYFGVFDRQENTYGFNKEELYDFLVMREVKCLFAVYSDCRNLHVFQSEIDKINNSFINNSVPPMYQYEILPHWILIDAPSRDCERRIAGRNLTANVANMKRDHINEDKALLEVKKKNGFFDVVIDNSDSNAFNEAADELHGYICRLF